MYRIIIFSSVLLSSSAIAQDTADSLNLLNLETAWNNAHLEANAAALDSLWSDDLQVTVPGMRTMSKSDVLGFVRSGRMKFQRYETTNVHVAVAGDSATVKGIVHRARTINNEKVEDHWQFLKGYVRRAGRWQVVLWKAE
jgi:hypothetical protein